MEDLHYVYLLKCANGKYYTDCAKGLEGRLHRHNREFISATKKNQPLKLIAYRAFECEKHPKIGSGRAVMDKQLGKIRA
jgi:putative endonuclease